MAYRGGKVFQWLKNVQVNACNQWNRLSSNGTRSYSQSAAKVKGDSRSYSQSAAEVKGGKWSYSQSAAEVKGGSRSYSQSAAEVKGDSRSYSQSTAKVKGDSSSYSQSAAEVKGGSRSYSQSAAEVKGSEQSGKSDFGNLLLIIPITTFCLGTWQVRRRKWKLGLIRDLDMRTTADPIDLPTDPDALKDLEYRRVRIKGVFDHSKEIYVTPRQLQKPGGEREGGGIISSGGQSGAWVVTPFYCTDLGINILVNRGWVPRDKINPTTRPNGQIKDEVEIVAIIRCNEKRPPFTPENDIAHNRWMYRDVFAMAKYAGTEPIYVDADLKSTIKGGPFGGQTRVNLRNEHWQYIITWYSLCAATTLMWYFGVYKKRKFIKAPQL